MSEPDAKGRARLVLAGACFVIFFSAYEVLKPLFSIGPVSFTTSEVAALVFLATALVWVASDRRRSLRLHALDIPVALFIASAFLSSAFAEDRPSAMKFTLRLTFAALLYFGISRLPGRSYRSHLVVGGAIAVTLVTVAAIGLLETFYFISNNPRLLEDFQQGVTTFGTFYNVRTTATLSFPTVLSFYLQLMLPLALAFAIWLIIRERRSGRRWAVVAATVAVTVAVMTVQIYTYTRSGLVSAPLSMLFGAVVAAAYGLGKRTWSLFLLAALSVVALVGFMLLSSDRMAVRLGLAEQQEVYTAGYTLASFPLEVEPGAVYEATVRTVNTSPFIWDTEGPDEVTMTYRWLTYPEKEEIPEDNLIISSLPGRVLGGEEADIVAGFRTPSEEGTYVLVFDLAKAHVGWFSSSGTPPLIVPLEIGHDGSSIISIDEKPADFIARKPSLEAVPRRTLWEAAYLMWKDNPVIGVGSDQFRLRYNEYVPEVRHDERVRTHNILLEALADHGIIGLAVMMYLLAAAAWTQFRLVRDRERDGIFRVFALGLLVAMAAYVMHGVLDWFLWQTGVAFIFFILLGLTAWLDYEAASGSTPD